MTALKAFLAAALLVATTFATIPAAAEGRLPVVEYFIAHGAETSPRDRWGNSPLDEAIRHDQDDVASLLRRHGARSHGINAGEEADEPRPRAAAG